MGVLLLALLLVLIFIGVGFLLHVLWWIAVAAFVVWLAGVIFRAGSSTRSRR